MTDHHLPLRTLASEYDYRDAPPPHRWDIRGTAEILQEHRKEISVGSPGDAIDNLSGSQRQLLEAQEFHARGNSILKKVTPEEETDQAIDFGKLPKELREVVELLELLEVPTIGIREQIRLLGDNEESLKWVARNYREFIDFTNAEKHENVESELRASPPRDRYTVVERFRPSSFKEAYERRLSHLKSTLGEIDKLVTVEQVEKFMARIRDDYWADRNLISQWSKARREEDRAHYVHWLRRSGCDMEQIRGKTWAAFDRVPSVRIVKAEQSEGLIPNWMQYMRPNGSVPKEATRNQPKDVATEKKVTDQPFWDVERSKAFCDLTQTTAQWRRIYSYLWEKMGEAILGRARAARNSAAQLAVRKLLGRYQFRLSQDVRREIVAALNSRA